MAVGQAADPIFYAMPRLFPVCVFTRHTRRLARAGFAGGDATLRRLADESLGRGFVLWVPWRRHHGPAAWALTRKQHRQREHQRLHRSAFSAAISSSAVIVTFSAPRMKEKR